MSLSSVTCEPSLGPSQQQPARFRHQPNALMCHGTPLLGEGSATAAAVGCGAVSPLASSAPSSVGATTLSLDRTSAAAFGSAPPPSAPRTSPESASLNSHDASTLTATTASTATSSAHALGRALLDAGIRVEVGSARSSSGEDTARGPRRTALSRSRKQQNECA